MKLVSAFAALLVIDGVQSFAPTATTFVAKKSTVLNVGNDGDVVFGGNTWKPESESMGSTDTGDFFPDDYEAQVEFTEGMMGSQKNSYGGDGPELPGMENLGEDAIMMGGIEEATEIPADMDFTPPSVPDGELNFSVTGSSEGKTEILSVAPVCMTFEDFFCKFADGSHPSLSVSPATGRMDRRGGEISEFEVSCKPGGKAGTFEGDLVINLPEDNSKIYYKVTVKSV